MKFLNSLIARIWGPFMLVALLLTALVGFYIPNQQAGTLREFQLSELSELVKVMANNISIAGEYDDWSNMADVFKGASNRPSIEFSALILETNGIFTLVASSPPGITEKEIQTARGNPLLVSAPFQGGSFKGKVIVLGSQSFIDSELSRLNFPLQVAMLFVLLAVFILYFFLKTRVSKPLREVRTVAEQIGRGDLKTPVGVGAKIWELESLNHALEGLRTGLLEQRNTNKALTKGMENEIKRQTKDLRKTLDELQDSRNLFGSAIESALDAMVIADGKSRILEWNRKAELIFGWSREEALGQSLSKLIIPEHHREGHSKGMSHYHATGQGPVLNKSFETQGLRRNGEVFDIELYITSVQIDKEEVFSSFIRDITESKQLAQDLEKQRELNSELLNGLPLMITLKGRDLKYRFVNSRAIEVLGKGREEMIGRTESEVFETEWVNESVSLDKKTWAGDQVKPIEYRLKSGDDHHDYLIGRYLLSIGQEKKTSYLLTYGFEVSQLKTVQMQLQDALKTKDEFLATVSHEIRTPLHSIIVLAELLNDPKRHDERDEFNANILSSSRHLLNLVNDILDFSKADAQQLGLAPKTMDLTAFVDQLTRVDTESRSSQVEFTKEIMGCENILIKADETRLNQIIQNLLSNAFKFTEKGRVTLRVSGEKQGLFFLMNWTVQDTGIGISQEDQDKVLLAFQQAHSGISRKFGGTGLGLGIVVKLLQLMDSQLELDSTPGEGTSFSFKLLLPIAQEAPVYNASLKPVDTVDTVGNSVKMLYVEDLMPNQMVMKAMCKPLEVDLTIVSSGKDAILACKTQEFDLILMDIQMPEMDGFKTLTSLKTLEKFKQSAPQVLAFTAHAGQEQQNKFLSFGFNGALTKPLTPQQLQALLAEYSNHERSDSN